MLRVYKPIEADDIFELHLLVEHLVCEVWCKADNLDFNTKLLPDLQIYSKTYEWVGNGISKIYEKCKDPNISNADRKAISNAFIVNNKIEELCDGTVQAIAFDTLPTVAQVDMKDFLINFYEELLNRKKVKGDKLDYYKKLQELNQFRYCPCCGFMHFSTGQIGNREDYDHYLPKYSYPFCSVNFKNLVPLCDKCNQDSKGTKDPINNNSKAFYPFQAASTDISISTTFSSGLTRKMYDVLVNSQEEKWPDVTEIQIDVSGADDEKVVTWDKLFNIKNRYAENTSKFTFSELKRLKIKHAERELNNLSKTFVDSLEYYKKDYKNDYYDDEKFLKIPFIQSIINTPALSANYQ